LHVYELAIQLGKRSIELTEVAEQLGMGHLIAASPLTAEQHQQLLTHFTGIAPPPPPGGPSFGAPVGGMAPAPSMAGPSGRGVPKVVLAVGAVVIGALLFGGAYTMVSGERDELTRHVDAEAAADDRGEIPESETTQPAPASPGGTGPAGAPGTTAPITEATAPAPSADPHVRLCVAAQKVSDLDDEGDVLNTDAPTWEQFIWAMDQLEATMPALSAAYGELAVALPPDVADDVEVVRAGTEDIVRQMSAIASPDQMQGAMAAMEARAGEINGSLMLVDAYVQGECDITIAD
jgi:hypothetical protein